MIEWVVDDWTLNVRVTKPRFSFQIGKCFSFATNRWGFAIGKMYSHSCHPFGMSAFSVRPLGAMSVKRQSQWEKHWLPFAR